MLYDYGCHECGETLKDVKQSIHDEALTLCPSCGKHSLERVPYGGLGSFMKNSSNTIGGQADKNWSNMGHYQKSEIEAKREIEQGPAKEKKSLRKKINNMSASQKKNYILRGDN
jgi:putative FmdB family regulatory protein